MGDASTVALLGTGRMGAAMATTLHRAGFRLVLWNRDAGKAEQLGAALAAAVAPSAAQACRDADFVLSSLADDQAVRAVYLDAEGVVDGVGAGTVVLDTSTVDPATSIQVGDAVERTGASFLDCPVSGSVATVLAGTLTIMAGGEADVVRRAAPILDPLSQRVVHTGKRGTGAATKLAVNSLVHGLNVALCEALVLAERAGIDRKTAYEVFASGAGGAPFVHYKREAFENPDTATVAFNLDLVAKDLELITTLGERVGAPLEQAQTGLRLVSQAIEAGFGAADLSALAVYLRLRETARR